MQTSSQDLIPTTSCCQTTHWSFQFFVRVQSMVGCCSVHTPSRNPPIDMSSHNPTRIDQSPCRKINALSQAMGLTRQAMRIDAPSKAMQSMVWAVAWFAHQSIRQAMIHQGLIKAQATRLTRQAAKPCNQHGRDVRQHFFRPTSFIKRYSFSKIIF